MSDEEQGAIPEEQPESEPTPEAEAADGDAAGEPESAETEGAAEAEGEAESGESEPSAAEAEEVQPDAAAALLAAQQAVAAAQGEEIEGSDEAVATVETAQESADVATDDIAAMMAQAEAEGAASFPVPDFSPSPPAATAEEMQLLGDVNVDVRIELGRTRMLVEDVLRLGEGAVVELEKLAGDPVDVYVNGRHVARGEVLVLNESFCVRVNEVLEPVSIDQIGD